MKVIYPVLFLAFLSLLPATLFAHEARLESGLFSTGYNKFAIPNPAGTRVTFTNSETGLYYRATAMFQVSERGFLRFLAAPLESNYTFSPVSTVLFHGTSFAAGERTEVNYRFDSYRAAYLYRFPLGERFTAQIGGVGKVRVAKIGLRNGAASAEYNNTGFVPLLNLGLFWRLSRPLELKLDLDGAVAKQGRAVDGALELFYRFDDAGSGLSAGYRILEGGADNDKVYTFALFHYGYLALTYGF